MKRIAIILFTALMACQVAFSQEESASAALGFVEFGKNPSIDGMGGAGLASVSSIAWASFSNVAAVPFSSKKMDIALSYQLWQPSSTHYANLGGAVNIGNKVGVCFGASAGIDPSYIGMTEDGLQIKQFMPMDLQANLGVSYRFVEWVSLGVNARYAMQRIAEGYTLSSFMTDVFVMGNYKDFSLALGAVNLGTKASYGKKSGLDLRYSIPTAVAMGFNYAPVFAGVHGLELNLDLRCSVVGAGVAAAAGASYTYNNIISLRGGYCYGGKSFASHGTVGLGIQFCGVHIDAAYYVAAKGSPIANTVSVGLGYAF